MIDVGVEVRVKPLENVTGRIMGKITLVYLLSGRIGISLCGRTAYLETNDILVINSEERSDWTVLKDGVVCELLIERSVLEGLMEGRRPYFACNSVGDQSGKYERLGRFLNELLHDYLQNDRQVNFTQMISILKILQELVERFRSEDGLEQTGQTDGYQDQRMRQVLQYIEENYSQQISLKELAQMLYVTESHLSRLLKRELGESYLKYVNRIRLEHARDDLIYSDKPIIRISGDNGFSGMAIFNKSFKEHFGVTPSQYRRDNREMIQQNFQARQEINRAALACVEQNLRQVQAKQNADAEALRLDVSKTEPLMRPWQRIINGGTASELLNSKLQRHILFLRETLHFSYVRIWGLFQDQMMMLPQKEGETFSFSKLDDILTFLTANHLKPMLQLGPKPRIISASVQETIMREDNTIASYSAKEWGALMDALVCHLVENYGAQEVESWIFEMWSPAVWDGVWFDWYSEEMFVEAYRAVKRYVPAAQVGGGEFTPNWHSQRMEDMAACWRAADASPDFFSYTAFPYFADGTGAAKTRWITDSDGLLDMVECAKQDQRRCNMAEKPLFFTTWNLTISSRNILNDTVFKGAYIIKNALDIIGKADMLCYWTCSDLSFEYKDCKRILFGGAGLLTRDGIRKPACYAYEFLERLKNHVIARTGNYIVTRNSHGSYAIVYHNMKHLGAGIYLKKEYELDYEDLNYLFEDRGQLVLDLILEHMENGSYNIRRQCINPESGSVLDEWERLGGFTNITGEDIEYIKQISVPKRTMQRCNVDHGTMNLHIQAAPNEFGLIEIFPSYR